MKLIASIVYLMQSYLWIYLSFKTENYYLIIFAVLCLFVSLVFADAFDKDLKNR